MSTNSLLLQQVSPILETKQVQDQYIRKNFVNLQQYFQSQNQLLNFQFFDIVFSAAVTNQKVQHGLSYIPRDIIMLAVTGSGLVTFNLGIFDSTNMNITTTGACHVRFFAGTYWNQQVPSVLNKSDVVQFGAVTTYTAKAPNIIKFTAAGSLLYYIPSAGVVSAEVEICGGGGGGGGGGTGDSVVALDGGQSTFGTLSSPILTAGGGKHGIVGNQYNVTGFGGTPSVVATTGLQIVYSFTGGAASPGLFINSNSFEANGSQGGQTPFLNGGGAGGINIAGQAGVPNSGGGGGGGGGSIGLVDGGQGGGSGAYIRVVLNATLLATLAKWPIYLGLGGTGATGSVTKGGNGGSAGCTITERF